MSREIPLSPRSTPSSSVTADLPLLAALPPDHSGSLDLSGLSPRLQRFVAEYLICGRAATAAKRAGFTPRYAKDKAYLILRRPAVAAAIAAERARLHQASTVTLDRVIAELAKLAFADPRALFTPAGRLKPLNELDDASAAAIAAFDVMTVAGGPRSSAGRTARARLAATEADGTKGGDATGETAEEPGDLVLELRKVRCWDKLKALELLGRYLGIFKDKVELGVTADLARAIETARKRSQVGDDARAMLVDDARVVEGKVINDAGDA